MKSNLVRLGGAGAVFPRLFVVLLIWTIADPDLHEEENVLSLDESEISYDLRRNLNSVSEILKAMSYLRLEWLPAVPFAVVVVADAVAIQP